MGAALQRLVVGCKTGAVAMMRWSRGAFWFPILFGVTALLMLALSMASANLNFDEAYNLQVADSMVGARTYASYGALDGTGPWAFDPHVTTGLPAMVPVALAWWLSGGQLMSVRVVMLVWLGAYIWGCLKLWRPHASVGHQRAQQLVVCAPILIVGFEDLGDFRGELPGSTLVILALVALDRRRFLIAGVLSALAVLTKLVLAAIIPLVLIGVFVASARGRVRNTVGAAVGALGTLALHEIIRVVTVGGWREYQVSIVELRSFLQRQRIPDSTSWHTWSFLAERWESLTEVATWGFFVFMAVAVALAVMNLRDSRRLSSQGASVIPLALGVALAPIMLAGWVLQSKSLAARQIVPVLLVAGPALLSLVVRSVNSRRLWVLSSVACGAIALAVVGGARIDLDPLSPRQHALQDELATMEVDLIFSNGWYQSPELQLLLGMPAIPWPMQDQVMVVGLTSGDSDELVPGRGAPWSPSEICGERFTVGDVELCHVRVNRHSEDAMPEVVNWGERSVEAGQIPNVQIDGQAGFWVVVEPESRIALSPLRIRIGERRLRGTEVSPEGDLLTALAPPTLFDDVGRLAVDIENLETGVVTPLGTVDVVEERPLD